MIGLIIVATSLAAPSYQEQMSAVAAERRTLSRELARASGPAQEKQVLDRAKQVLTSHVRHGLIEAWLGTPWDFNGISEVPGEGMIACGYLVSTVLRDAGLRVQRYKLAQQASEYIVLSLAESSDIQRFSDASSQTVVKAVEKQGDGVYVIGFDFHVGFLVVEDGSTEFCHSSYVGESVVMCTSPHDDPAFDSSYRVVGPIGDQTLRRWLTGRRVPTVTSK